MSWKIIDEDSARPNRPNEIAVGVAGSNHITMCKFNVATSQKYESLFGKL